MKIKLLAIFILTFISISLFAPFVISAQQSTSQTPSPQRALGTNPQSYPLNTNPDVPQNLSTYTQSVFIEILATASCFMSGYNPLRVDGKCLGIDPITKKLAYGSVDSNGGGLIAVAGSFISATYNMPVSSGQYGMYLAENFGIADKASAQALSGVGFEGLRPILGIWIAFRNIAYIFFVIVFVVIGLGIMFRLNIDPRTIMTIQNQIPKIIVALVLITFSYAIAGFLIDLMYVSMFLIIYIFDAGNLSVITSIDTNPINAVGNLGGINAITEPAANSVGNALGGIFQGALGGGLANFFTKIFGTILGATAGVGIGKLIGGLAGLGLGIAAVVATGGLALGLIPIFAAIGGGVATGGLVGSFIGGAAGGAVGFAAAGSIIKFLTFIIAYIIILIAVLQALFRTWFALIKAYIYILIAIIFAPFWILGGIIPGVEGGVGAWLRSLVANLAAFPTVLVLFLIAKTIQEQGQIQGQSILIPPFIGSIGADSASGFSSIIGLGIILIMPEAVNMVRSLLKAPDFKSTAAIGQALMVGQGAAAAIPRRIGGQLFGEDRLGRTRPLSQFIGQRAGTIARGLTGGGFRRGTGERFFGRTKEDDNKEDDNKGKGTSRIPPGAFGSGGATVIQETNEEGDSSKTGGTNDPGNENPTT